jgi:hypothetical protein
MLQVSMARITEEQYILATSGISITESEQMIDFERQSYVDLAMREKKLNLQILTAALGGGVSRLS